MTNRLQVMKTISRPGFHSRRALALGLRIAAEIDVDARREPVTVEDVS